MQAKNEVCNKHNGIREWQLCNHYVDDEIAKKFIAAIENDKNINGFYCHNNTFSDSGITSIISFIKANKNFQHIYFLDNRINDQQALIIAKILEYSLNIVSVSFIDYDFTAKGATAIARALKDSVADLKIQVMQGPPISQGLPSYEVEVEILKAIKLSPSIIYYSPPDRFYNANANVDANIGNNLHDSKSAFLAQIATNIIKLKDDCAKIKANMALTRKEYYILYSQLSFCISQPFLAPKCKIEFSSIMLAMKYQISEKLFLHQAVCRAENPFAVNYNLPIEMSRGILKQLFYHDIINDRKENTAQVGL